MAAKLKRPKDANQHVKNVVDLATDKGIEHTIGDVKNPAAVELGRLGGLKGGRARAESLSAKRRKQIAKKAANARWKKR